MQKCPFANREKLCKISRALVCKPVKGVFSMKLYNVWSPIWTTTLLLVCCGEVPPDFEYGHDANPDPDPPAESDNRGDTMMGPDTDTETDTPPPACIGNGHDEDDDGIDDNCDNCPTHNNPEQTNSDGDDIGDICEWPDREAALNTISVFDPLEKDQIKQTPLWLPDDNNAWTLIKNGYAGAKPTIGTNSYYPVDIEPPFSIEATFRFDQLPPPTFNSLPGWTSIVFAAQTASNEPIPSKWWQCALRWPPSGESDHRLELRDGVSKIADAPVEENQGRRLGVRRTLRVYYDGSNTVMCTLDNNQQGSQTTVLGLQSKKDFQGTAGLRVYNEKAIFESFVIYH